MRVRNILARVGVPARPANKEERIAPHYYPDECLSDEYNVGEIAWSATYHAPVEVLYQLTAEYLSDKVGMVNVNYENKYANPKAKNHLNIQIITFRALKICILKENMHFILSLRKSINIR